MAPASLFLLVLLLLSSTPLLNAAGAIMPCDITDQKSLLKLKSDFGNPAALSTWDPSTSCCTDWDYVICQGAGQVLTLTFDSANLSGPIPPSITNFPFLQYLIFRNIPALTGPIPTFLSNLTLRTLHITYTSISGPIPPFLATMSHIGDLVLSHNNLTGPIPDVFMATAMKGLFELDLSGNQLTGSIPPSIYRGTTMATSSPLLYLSGNKLTGAIPTVFGNIDFGVIDLSHNRLTGDASFLFGSNKSATGINLSWNKLEFDMSGLGFGPNLANLDISHNRIRGSIPKAISGLKNLNVLDVSYNQLCGRIPHKGQNVGVFNSSSYVGNKCLCGAPLPRCGA